MRKIISVNDIWADLPPEYSAKVAHDITKGNIVSVAVESIYGDLDYIFSERVKFPLRKGAIQEMPYLSEYSHIKHALYLGRKIPVIKNGDVLEIPIQYWSDNHEEKDFFEIKMVVIPKPFIDEDDENKIKINIDTRIKSLLQAAIVREMLAKENNTDNPMNGFWDTKYRERLQRFKTMHGNMQDTDQMWNNTGDGIPDFRR